MKYTQAQINTSSLADWQVDLLVQQLAEIGFDSFEQNDALLHAYIPTTLSDEQALRTLLADSPATLLSLTDCPDENWNSTWEQDHPVQHLPLGVTITPHCAFGAGHHETTSMMIDALLEIQNSTFKIQNSTVLDMGTGTGVLAIMAAKIGAEHVVAVDIDENSVLNAKENAQANNVQIDVRLGDSVPDGQYSLIMANIHRNILLAQMPDFARTLLPDGELWLSGFYEADVPVLIDAANKHGLEHLSTQANGEWRMIRLRQPAQPRRTHSAFAIAWVLIIVLGLFTGCHHRSHLSSRKMVAVLTDLHRTEGMLQVSGLHRGHDNEQTAYYEAVLAAHNVTKAEFDSSLVWYTHHPQRFNKLYPKVIKNLDAEHALFVGEAEQNRALVEQRRVHFEWFTVDRVIHSTQRGYELSDYRLLPVDSVHVPVPMRP